MKEPNHVLEVKSSLFKFTFNVLTRMIMGRRYYGKVGEKSKEGQVTGRDRVGDVERGVTDERAVYAGCDAATSADEVKQKKNKTMVEVLLDLQRSEPEYYTDETIKNLLLVLLQGGSSTSTIALEWAFSLLLDNPEP